MPGAVRAAAAQLVAVGDLSGYRFSRCSDTDDWAIDTVEVVAAEVGAALRLGIYECTGIGQ